MKPLPRLLVAFTCLLAAATGLAQEKGAWRAASNNARSITGDVAFSDSRVTINFATFTLAEIRALTPAELTAVFGLDDAPAGPGNLYRVSIPSTKQFLKHNTLCGGEDTNWILTYVSGKTLRLAMFSGGAIPALTPEAIANSTSLCGSYTYVR